MGKLRADKRRERHESDRAGESRQEKAVNVHYPRFGEDLQKPRDGDRSGAVAEGAVSQLAVVVPAPAGEFACGQAGAGVRFADGYLPGVGDAAHRHRQRARDCSSVSQLARAAGAPALDAAAAHNSAGVISTGADR